MTTLHSAPRCRLGLYGGSFDPIHLGHLKTACFVLKSLELDCLYLLPNASPPHKDSLKLPYTHRAAMIEAALADFHEPKLQLSYLEQDSSVKHYTINTLETFGAEHPDSELYFVMGMDSLLTLDTWKDYPHLIDLANLVVLPRPHYELSALKSELHDIVAPYLIDLRHSENASPADGQNHYYLLPSPEVDVSSTEIRGLLQRDREELSPEELQHLHALMSPSALHYIAAHGLYRGQKA